MESNILLISLFTFVVVGLLYIIPHRFRIPLLALCSSVFYLLCDAHMFLLLVATSLYTYYGGHILHRTAATPHRVRTLWYTILPLLCILFLAKYLGLMGQWAHGLLLLFDIHTSSNNMVQAISILGLSYYIFRSVSYLCDVYQHKIPAEPSWLSIYTYTTFFPQIICGPISRYSTFSQHLAHIGYRPHKFVAGIQLIILGIFMKTVIADNLSNYVNQAFGLYDSVTGLALWMGAFFYSIQLYCDFAGYSYVATGFTLLMGLDCETNFNLPYFSKSIKEFWNRWHLTLSTWLRDYIYIPLGGSRCSKRRKFIHIMVTFLLSGAWHGAGLTFIVWGALHGLGVHLSPQKAALHKGVWRTIGYTVGTFMLTMFLWIIFRADDLHTAFIYILRMFTAVDLSIPSIQEAVLLFTNDNSCLSFLVTYMSFITLLALREWRALYSPLTLQRYKWLWYTFLLCSIMLFGHFGAGFIYGNF